MPRPDIMMTSLPSMGPPDLTDCGRIEAQSTMKVLFRALFSAGMNVEGTGIEKWAIHAMSTQFWPLLYGKNCVGGAAL